jgi:ligand-binding SRPBCC domain-containing protein
MGQHRNRHGLRNLLLILAGLSLAEGNRRWNERFVVHSLTPEQVAGSDGHLRDGRRVVVQSILPAPPEKVWAKVKDPTTLLEVTHPLLGFIVRDGRPFEDVWQPGGMVSLDLLGMGLVPLGRHDITVSRIDEGKREIETRETGRLAAIWNHLIRVEPYDDNQTLYTDRVDLAAGSLNEIAGRVAHFFFRYRQTRWQHLVRSMPA